MLCKVDLFLQEIEIEKKRKKIESQQMVINRVLLNSYKITCVLFFSFYSQKFKFYVSAHLREFDWD